MRPFPLTVAVTLCGLSWAGAAATAFELDAGRGTDLPTPAAARDRIRELRTAGTLAADRPVVITLAPGDYVLAETLSLSTVDSGAEGAPVTWRAAVRGTVRLLGAAPLAATRFAALPADDPIRARIDPDAASRTVAADVAADLPATLPAWGSSFRSPPAPWFFRGGCFQDLARYPNRASATSHGWALSTNVTSSGASDRTGVAFTAADLRPSRWNFGEGVWLYGYWGNTWSESYAKAASWNPETRVLTLAGSVTYVPGVGPKTSYPKYVAVNVPEELDAEGEWWLDRSSRRLYYVPPAGGLADGELALSAFTGSLLALSAGVHDIRFENLVFAYAGTGFTTLGATRRVTFEGCDSIGIVNPSAFSGTDNAVRDCSFLHYGCGCLTFTGGSRAKLTRARNAAVGCTFRDFGHLQQTSVPAVSMNGCGHAVRHCTISESPHEAIGYMGSEHFIGYNEIHHVLRETADAGAIYTGRNTSTLGTQIVGNLFHDLDGTDVSGIYFDDCDWGDDAIANTFTNVYRAFLVGGGNLHRIQWNRMKTGNEGICIDRRGVTWANSSSWLRGERWCWSGFTDANPSNHPWTAAYPDLLPTLNGTPREPFRNVLRGNLIEDYSTYTTLTTAQNSNSHSAMTNGMEIADNVTASTKGAKGTSILGFTHLQRSATPADVPGLTDALARVAAFASATTEVAVVSPDRKVCAYVGVDETGRLACRATSAGKVVLDRSVLGVTVDGVDYGRLQRPCAEAVSTSAESGFTVTAIPLEDVVRGGTNATVEVRVCGDGLAWRLRVKGTGPRIVAGLVADWRLAEGGGFSGSAIPTGGWTCTGEVVTPWQTAQDLPAAITNGVLFVDVPAGVSKPLTASERAALADNLVKGIVKTGKGTLTLAAPLTGYAGWWIVSNGVASVQTPYDAFGSAGDAVVTAIENPALSASPIAFAATATINRPLTVKTADKVSFSIASGADVTFLRRVLITGSAMRFYTGGSGSCARFRGGFSCSPMTIPSGSGTVVFSDVPASMAWLWLEGSVKVRFECPSNAVSRITCCWGTGGLITFGCADALAGYANMPVGDTYGYTLDLNGFDLAVGNLDKHTSGTIASERPATLRFRQAGGTTNSACAVTGAVTLSKTGEGEYAVRRSVGSTGNLLVDQGTFRMMPAAAWPCAGRVGVSGTGRLVVEGDSAFGEATCVAVAESGRLVVSNGVTLTCAEIDVRGTKAAPGLHSAADLGLDGAGSVLVTGNPWLSPDLLAGGTADARCGEALRAQGFSDEVAGRLADEALYGKFTDWAKAKGLAPAALASGRGVILAAAMGLAALPDADEVRLAVTNLSVASVGVGATTNSVVAFELSVDAEGFDPSGLDEDLLKAALGVTGAEEIDPEVFSSDALELEYGAVRDGKLPVTVTPRQTGAAPPAQFFIRTTAE